MTRPTAPKPPRSEKDRAARYHELAETMRGLEADLRWGLTDSLRLPRAWSEIAARPGVPKKLQLTIRLDDDIVAFFRAMGRGHLTRINAVLRTFMLARLAGVVTGAEGVTYAPTFADEANGLRREIMALMREEEMRQEEAAREAMADPEARRIRLRALREMRDERVKRKGRDLGVGRD